MKQKGFTLIELLVVIAIIGILSSVVLASLTTARTKGQDAAVQQQLASMRAQAELYSTANGNQYWTAALGASSAANCDLGPFLSTGTGGMANLVAGIRKLGVIPTCTASTTGWAVYSPLPSSPGYGFCVDSNGKAATSSGTNGAGCM
ncbi:MAG: type II secretion system protein [bacterium]